MKKIYKLLTTLSLSIPLMAVAQNKAEAPQIENSEVQENYAFKEVENAKSLLDSFDKYVEKKEVIVHPGLLTYEKDLLPQGKRNFQYSLNVQQKDKVIYSGNFEIENSTMFTFYNGMSQLSNEYSENSKKGDKSGPSVEGEKAKESNKLQTIEIALMLHSKKNSDNLLSQFFYEVGDKSLSKEMSVGKIGDKIAGNQDVKGPEELKDRGEFIIRHSKGSQTEFSWKEYTFKVKVN